MSATEFTKTLQYKIDSKFSFNFDELQNIKLINRKSDIGFSEDEKMMLAMRNWTSRVWNSHTTAWWVSKQFFFTDFFRNRWHLKWYNNKIWRLESNVWTDLSLWFTWNNFNFNPVKLPLMVDWSLPTIYTSPTDSSSAEKIVRSASDLTSNAVWYYLVITDDPNNNQAYRWAFAVILADDWTEYTLEGSWVSQAVTAWAKYQIYDVLWEHLQISNWIENEKYIFIKSDFTIVENTAYEWLVTKNLKNIKVFESTQYLEKQLAYSASYFVFNKWTLYYSSWAINNPFFYDFSSAFTIPWNNWWDIDDIFTYKWRLIIWWSNFIAYTKTNEITISWVSTSFTEIKTITSSYWIVKESLVDLWVDAYFMTTNKKINSLSETITWALKIENVWKQVNNYLKDFNYWVCAWYDWRNLYFYWQEDSSTIWKMIVLDIEYSFWSTYTWLRPSTILLEAWSVYLSDNNSDIIRFFVEWKTTDIDELIEQKISTKDIDLWDPFSTKTLSDLYFWLDNYTQSLIVDTYLSLSVWNFKKDTKKISITEVDVEWVAAPMWEWLLWEWILGWFAAEKLATYPFMEHIQYNSDKANIWKVIITWFEWSAFYLNQFDIEIWFDENKKNYFNPATTI